MEFLKLLVKCRALRGTRMLSTNRSLKFSSDRKKDLVKLQQGEYISLGKVESEMKTCPLVDNICIYGDSSKLFTVALLVPAPKQVPDNLKFVVTC